MLEKGMLLPDFKMENQHGDIITNQDLFGKKTVLYFYPRDNTPTCTTQACDFNDNLDVLNELDAQVYGVSGDSKVKHTNFINKHNLKFDLLVDEDYTFSEQLGIYRLKKSFGKESMGIVRTTIILDDDTRIIEVFDGVKVKTQMEDIKKVLEGDK
ncbi:peroxiredoxin [Macrococcoides canis]|uniref:peroxiredoxin n=1 Tax=Macrococcoides canis TaxID=1855823 RepID=UPI0013E94629|nr:peroxiredoxin [Macrococcus canis]MCO4097584.1 peroxiredoxin [Macrococcus canis]QIH76570.1 redoxin domain-containing protein [Macrococcus canis]QTQ07652.1 peroxiredoxin [Macrococcus canis]QUR95071.1 redoxin domain-containing protein [Macrococcus canis]UTH01956.1 peroxiredoxin [Macrococcus canis]